MIATTDPGSSAGWASPAGPSVTRRTPSRWGVDLRPRPGQGPSRRIGNGAAGQGRHRPTSSLVRGAATRWAPAGLEVRHEAACWSSGWSRCAPGLLVRALGHEAAAQDGPTPMPRGDGRAARPRPGSAPVRRRPTASASGDDAHPKQGRRRAAAGRSTAASRGLVQGDTPVGPVGRLVTAFRQSWLVLRRVIQRTNTAPR